MTTASDVVESVVRLRGIDLEELKRTKAGSRVLLRITLDGDGASGHGLSLDEVAEVSSEISLALDESDVMGQTAYVLEVGTRGVDAPLTNPAHYRRNIGRLVKINCGDETVTGRIVASDDEAVQLESDQRIAFAEITKAVVQIEMNRADNEAQED
ncbi:MAG: ribosome maturation factor RimP [Propionibacteriaceae bacterium]|jgi:ribosome maturation factor RimP|nr:ribosome maturation factor RimP [Propionibacteriaceae bacterium]